jgi:uncharacterized protein
MTDTVLETMTRQMMTLPVRHISLGWQGGEPTLMGRAFFERAIAHQIRYGHGKSVGNSLQTNGHLIDDAWARFLRKYNFLVGLSIDGPAPIHDKYRTSNSGEGSWSGAIAAAKRLQDHGVMVNSLTVVNNHTAKFASEIYSTLKDLGFEYQQYIPCVVPAPGSSSRPVPFSVSPEAYGGFLVTLFDRWWEDIEDGIPQTTIRLFDALLAKYLGAPPSDCTLLARCGVYLVVEYTGDVYPCDFFVSDRTRLGNLLEIPLEELFRCKPHVDFGDAKQCLNSACSVCEWLWLCGGGCPKERPEQNGLSQKNVYCASYKQLFSHADHRLLALADNLRARENNTPITTSMPPPKPIPGKVGRNAPCPCGSGMKFKRCCGR